MFSKGSLIYKTLRRNVSTIYTTGEKASKNFTVLQPYLDFNEKLDNKQKLEMNIKHRKMNVDLNEVHLLWLTYLDLEKKKSDLQRKREELHRIIMAIDPKTDGGEILLTKQKSEAISVKNDLKKLKENSEVLESDFIHKFLYLPNNIHERTPIQANEIVYSYSSQEGIVVAESHLTKTDYLEYHDPFCYFLKGDAAKCDIQLSLYCMQMFRAFDFIAFSNPDFIRSVLVEAAGVPIEQLLTIQEDDSENKLNLLHLAGSGSMLGFLGFLARLTVYQNQLPLKFASSGKGFSNPTCNDSGLYSAWQKTHVQLFGMTSNETESLQQFDETLRQMIEFYKKLDRSFRVSYVTSDKLARTENLRAEFEMYSHHQKCFISVGQLSSYGDFISKRLLITYKDLKNAKQLKFPQLISGSVNVTNFLAILLEDKGALKTPKVLNISK